MDFNTFENELFFELNSLNKKCIKKLDAHSDAIKANLGDEGNPKTIDKFVLQFNDCLLQKIKEKKFSLFEEVIRHPSMKKVLESFQKSDILVQACKSAIDHDGSGKKMIKWLFTMDINYCVQDDDGMTALMYAVKNEKLSFVVKHILTYGRPSVHLVDKNGQNVLFHSLGQINILNELLRTEVDVNQKDYHGDNVLLYCCKNEIFEPIQYLTVRKDLNVNDIDSEEKTAAMYLAEKGKNSEFRTLNKRNCNYNYRNKKNESVLSILINKIYQPPEARQTGYVSQFYSILSSLVYFNCSFNIPVDEDENTALMTFIIVNDFCTLKYVLKFSKNYDLSVKNKYGENASSLCMKCKNSLFYSRLMIEKDTFDHDYVDQQTGNTMLMLGIIIQSNFIPIILENNINSINSVNHRQENALILAVKSDNRKYFCEILRSGIYVNQQDYLGNTALHYAVMIKCKFFIWNLLHYHADIHLKNSEGLSPLDLANKMSAQDIVQQLLDVHDAGDVTSHDGDELNESLDTTEKERLLKSIEEYLYPCITCPLKEYTMDEVLLNSEKRYYTKLFESMNETGFLNLSGPVTIKNWYEGPISISYAC